jgi:DNA modification methylase
LGPVNERNENMKKNLKGKETTKEVTQKIKKLYQRLVDYYKLSLTDAIEIGRLLSLQRDKLKHGQWIPWVKENLPFSVRSARNYISLYKNRAKLKRERVADLSAAYKVLANHKNQYRDKRRSETKKFRKLFADKPSKYVNSRIGYINQVLAGDNFLVMNEMLRHGMKGKYTAIICSPGYNSSFHYGKHYDDDKPYPEHLQDILKPFPLYPKLLRPGGRAIYIIGSIVKKKDRDDNGDYNHQIITDLINGVREVAPELRLFNQIIWRKTVKDPLNKQFGSFASPSMPMTRCCHEHILVWSNKQFELENIEGNEPDITQDEFNKWSWSTWSISPYSKGGNPHPCSFPPKLIERLLKFYTYPNSLILDPYGGVSTLAQVCRKLHRRYTTIELNPNYVEHASELLKSA